MQTGAYGPEVGGEFQPTYGHEQVALAAAEAGAAAVAFEKAGFGGGIRAKGAQ